MPARSGPLWVEGAAYDLERLLALPLVGIASLHTAAAVNDAGQIAVEAVPAGSTSDFPREIVVLSPIR